MAYHLTVVPRVYASKTSEKQTKTALHSSYALPLSYDDFFSYCFGSHSDSLYFTRELLWSQKWMKRISKPNACHFTKHTLNMSLKQVGH